jgi:hypothetical protein
MSTETSEGSPAAGGEEMTMKKEEVLIPEVMTFGKYKGRSMFEVAQDRNYVQWLLLQSWFPDRWPDVYKFLVEGGPTECTPEHNAMQARFLDDAFLRKFVSRLLINVFPEGAEWAREEPEFECEVPPCDVKLYAFATNTEFCNWCEKPLRKCFNEDGSWCRSFYPRSVRSLFRMLERTWFVELKPALGDDYPLVLRKLRGSGWLRPGRPERRIVVLFKDLTTRSISLKEIQQIFRPSIVLPLYDIENGEDKIGSFSTIEQLSKARKQYEALLEREGMQCGS